uniref:Uncharacterized protein n=1 Tax=Sparus aurata TaxID=8175 RepID=A0A671WKY0_SPAAU
LLQMIVLHKQEKEITLPVPTCSLKKYSHKFGCVSDCYHSWTHTYSDRGAHFQSGCL